MALKYRICLKNGSVDDERVQTAIAEELGKNIQVVDWWIERSIDYQSLVSPGIFMPQHMTIVGLEYELNVSAEDEDSQTTE